MAHHAVAHYQVSIRLSCKTFSISETCYRYQAKLSDENAEIADWLLRLSDTHKRWGFGLCFLYLRNIKGYGWNHKRVYRIYRELELNLRIKPRRRIKRDKPEALSVPDKINQVWSMDFMSDSFVNQRAKLTRVLGETALKSFHPRLYKIRYFIGASWSVKNGYYCGSKKTASC